MKAAPGATLASLTMSSTSDDKGFRLLTTTVHYTQVQKTINKYCVECHLEDSVHGVYTSYTSLMATGHVIPNDPDNSKLCQISILDPEPLDPNLPSSVAQTLCSWIAQGAQNN